MLRLFLIEIFLTILMFIFIEAKVFSIVIKIMSFLILTLYIISIISGFILKKYLLSFKYL